MSKKGGAAPPPAKEAKAPAKEKEVKAAAPAVDDKKAKQQPKQEPAKDNKPQDNKGNNNNKGKGAFEESAPANTPKQQQEPEDEVERGIMARVGKLEEEIKVHKDEIDSIRTRIEGKKQSQEDSKKKQQDLRQKSDEVGSMKEFNDQTAKLQKQRDEERAKLNAKQNEVKDLRTQLLEIKLYDDENKIIYPNHKDYSKALEKKIKDLQDHQSSGNISNIHEEKKLIAEIGKVSSYKKILKTYTEASEAERQIKVTLVDIDTQYEKLKTDKNDLWSKKKVFEDSIKEGWEKQKSTSAEIDKEIARRKELNDIVTELKKKVDALYDEKREHRAAKREKAKKERDDEIKKKQEEKKQLELKRQKEEEEKGTYADELEAITQLVQYLEPFKYKAPEVATEEAGEKAEGEGEGEKEDQPENPSTPPPAGEDARPKRGKKKAAENSDPEKELKHTAQIYFQFETVSIVAPAKVGEVEGSITQLNEKKEYLEKRSEDKKSKKKANGTQ